MRTTIAFLLVLSSTLSIWALCAQESPKNCPQYMAVACDPEGVHIGTTSANTYAIANVYDANFNRLATQTVRCDELSSPDPWQPGQECDETDPLFWIYCDPFPVV